jgi:hypothetical protein
MVRHTLPSNPHHTTPHHTTQGSPMHAHRTTACSEHDRTQGVDLCVHAAVGERSLHHKIGQAPLLQQPWHWGVRLTQTHQTPSHIAPTPHSIRPHSTEHSTRTAVVSFHAQRHAHVRNKQTALPQCSLRTRDKKTQLLCSRSQRQQHRTCLGMAFGPLLCLNEQQSKTYSSSD